MDEESFVFDENGAMIFTQVETPILADSPESLGKQLTASATGAYKNLLFVDFLESADQTDPYYATYILTQTEDYYSQLTDNLLSVITTAMSLAAHYGIDIQKAIEERLL